MPDPQPSEHRPYLDPEGDASGRELKQVPSHVYNRLKLAADAIAATKRMIPNQGNQVPSLKATNMNSYYRLRVMRDPQAWEFTTQEAVEAANENPEAAIAAKAELAHGGNCGEHAWVAYWYLRKNASGEHIQVSAKSGFDHAFVILGDVNSRKERDQDLVVSDPWVNKPTACLWSDHFAHCPRDKIEDHASQVADGHSYKEVIMGGLKLSRRGELMVQHADSAKDTANKTDDWKANHFWWHDDTGGEDYDYQPAPSATSTSSSTRATVE